MADRYVKKKGHVFDGLPPDELLDAYCGWHSIYMRLFAMDQSLNDMPWGLTPQTKKLVAKAKAALEVLRQSISDDMANEKVRDRILRGLR